MTDGLTDDERGGGFRSGRRCVDPIIPLSNLVNKHERTNTEIFMDGTANGIYGRKLLNGMLTVYLVLE